MMKSSMVAARVVAAVTLVCAPGMWAQNSTAPVPAAPTTPVVSAAPVAPEAPPAPVAPVAPATPAAANAAAAPVAPVAPAANVHQDAEQKIEVPAGTKILLSLMSGVNTKTAKAGDPVYLASTFPVVVNNHVVIPAGVDVQGVIDNVVRPGRVKGRAQVTMHFTTLIFPSGTVVSVPGAVDGLPGSDGAAVKGQEGTIEQPGSKGKDIGTVATSTATGAGLGGIIGSGSGHPGEGVGYGALAGGVGGVLYTLFTRGSEINLERGQTIEMVFQRPLTLEPKDIAVPPTTPGTQQYVPIPPQPPMAKPSAR